MSVHCVTRTVCEGHMCYACDFMQHMCYIIMNALVSLKFPVISHIRLSLISKRSSGLTD